MRLLEVASLCSTKAGAVRLLQEHGVLPSSKLCANGHQMALSLSKPGSNAPDRWRCCLSSCRQEQALRKNNWLQGSRLPFEKIILFIYFWAHDMHSILLCKRELDMNHSTTVDWCNYMREVCAASLLRQPTVIGGPNLTVQIDESMFSRRKNNVGRCLPQQWVFGGVCDQTGEVFIYAVPDRTAATLLKVIKECIRPGTTIISDCWKAYDGLANEPDYIHLKVNHSLNFVDPDSGAHTQKIENTWREAKRRNKKQFGTHRQMLDSYLCEFVWRMRNKHECPFTAIMKDIKEFWMPN